MDNIKNNHWVVDKNTMSISLLRFYVKIIILTNKSFIYYRTIINDDKKELTLNFYSIEDAILFTENEVINSNTIQEIIDKYDEKFKKDDFVVSFPGENPLTRNRKK